MSLYHGVSDDVARRISAERDRQVKLMNEATPFTWETHQAALNFLDKKVKNVIAAGVGPVNILSQGAAFVCLPVEDDGLLYKYVWGRIMRVKDDWDSMPTFKGWQYSSNSSVKPGTVEIQSHAYDPLDASHVPGVKPWGKLLAHVPPRPMNDVTFEVYQTLANDSYTGTPFGLDDREKFAVLAENIILKR